MGTAVGLVFGAGLFLVWRVVSEPARTPASPPWQRLRARLTERLGAAGIEAVSAAGLLWLIAASAGTAGLLVLGVSRTPPVAVAFAAIAGYAPLAVVSGRARKRRHILTQVWPEVVDHLASAVRAGLSLPEALTQVGERGPLELRASFSAFGRDYLASGRFGECLDRLKDRLADPVGDRVIEALRTAREVGGGDLGRMLRTLSRFLRDDARTRGELEARQAWVVNGARLATAAPWVVLLLLSSQPEVIGRYRSSAGVIILATGAVVCLVAYRMMVALGRLPDERRVLA
jgi:tight adherence protein B